MIRWRFVFSRLIIVVAILVLLRWGLGPVATYVTVQSIQQATGARVDVGKTRVGLFPPRVQYVDVQVADPRGDKQMRDAVSADSIELVIDGDALMHRRWVASNGKITGLKIGGKRAESGHLPPDLTIEDQPSGPSLLDRMIGAATEQFSDTADEIVDDLETVRRGKQIRDQWMGKYDELTVRARDLEKKVRQVRDRARGIDNPLRDWVELERTLAEAEAARKELLAIREEIHSMPGRLQSDLALLDEAKQIDMAKVDRYVPGDLAGAGDFGIDAITQNVRHQISQVKQYIQQGRSIADLSVVAPRADERSRGVDHDLRLAHLPALMIRRCEVSGVMRASGELFEVSGVVENLTPTPELLVEPTRARLNLQGDQSLRVEYIRDVRGGADTDLVTLHWPEIDAKAISLGGGDKSGLTIHGGKRELWVQIRNSNDQIDGRLVSKQMGVKMDLKVDDEFADKVGVQSLQNSLAAVDRIEIDAHISGSWNDFEVDLNTNLGQIMRLAGQDAIAEQVRQSKEKLAAKVNQVHLQQSVELRNALSEQAKEAKTLLASADETIKEMSRKVLSEIGDAEEMLGSRLRSAVMGKLR